MIAPDPQRLDSWKDIAAYLDRSVRTVQRWEREGLPVHRHDHRNGASIFAYRDEIDRWWTASRRHDIATIDDRDSAPDESHRPPRLAVLPFDDLGGNPEPYFADGFIEELITLLAGASGVHVVSRTSVMQVRDRMRYPIPRIAALLSADFIVEGTIQRRDDRIVASVRLVDPCAGARVVWGKRYAGPHESLPALQQAMVADLLAQTAAPSTEPPPPPKVRAPVMPQAHDAYLQGLYYLRQRTASGLSLARERFEQAVSFDSSDARPYAGLAEVWLLFGSNEFMAPDRSFALARAAAIDALKRDPDNAEAMAILGATTAVYEWRWEDAFALFDRAVGLRPDSGPIWHTFGMVSMSGGRLREAEQSLARARDIDPLSPIVVLNCMRPHFFRGDFEAALRACDEAAALAPTFWQMQLYRTWTLCAIGEASQALQAARAAVEQSNGHRAAMLGLAEAHAVAGDETEALRLISQASSAAVREGVVGYAAPFRVARVLARLQRIDQAFEALEQARRDRSLGLSTLMFDPALHPLATDPRFTVLMAVLGLVPVNQRATAGAAST